MPIQHISVIAKAKNHGELQSLEIEFIQKLSTYAPAGFNLNAGGSGTRTAGITKLSLDHAWYPGLGHDAALERFRALYDGTWRLDPESSGLKMIMIGDGVAQIYVPILFTIGGAGQPPQQTKFLMNLVLVKTPDSWRVSSILPIPAPAQ